LDGSKFLEYPGRPLVSREAAIFENLAQVELTVQGGMQNAPITGSFFATRSLLLARLHFCVRGNLDQSAVELQESLRLFLDFQKHSRAQGPTDGVDHLLH
jgi:hypothetical protein